MKDNIISSVFIILGLIVLLVGAELFIANKHFSKYESIYENLSGSDKEKFSEFYVFRLNNHFHGYFAKALGYPKNNDLQSKSIKSP